jgi:hypothetical protein
MRYITNYGVQITLLHPNCTLEHLGFLPGWLDENDPTPAKEQLGRNYMHGGGWRPFTGFKMIREFCLKFPGDPILRPIAQFKLHNEFIFMYDHAWVSIVQPDKTFEVCRMD